MVIGIKCNNRNLFSESYELLDKYVHTYMHSFVYTCLNIYINICVHTCIITNIRAHANINTYTYE
jgi:hypothetical protein